MDIVETYVVVCGIGRRSSHERTLSVVIRNKGLEPSYHYLGELETDRVGGEQRLDVSHLALAPLERLTLVITSEPGCEGKSCVRMCTYCFTCCLYVFTYYYTCCSMHCMRDPSRFLRYPYGPSGLLLIWTILLSIRMYSTGMRSGTGQMTECTGSGALE